MNNKQQAHFDRLYEQHVNALVRQGKSKVTIDCYARAVRRITAFFDRCPDQLSLDDLKTFFTSLAKSHSWSTVKIDRNGLQFFYKHVLGKQWIWVAIPYTITPYLQDFEEQMDAANQVMKEYRNTLRELAK